MELFFILFFFFKSIDLSDKYFTTFMTFNCLNFCDATDLPASITKLQGIRCASCITDCDVNNINGLRCTNFLLTILSNV